MLESWSWLQGCFHMLETRVPKVEVTSREAGLSFPSRRLIASHFASLSTITTFLFNTHYRRRGPSFISTTLMDDLSGKHACLRAIVDTCEDCHRSSNHTKGHAL
jgi:hypothetical protein